MYPAKPDPNATASQPAAWMPPPPVTAMAPPPPPVTAMAPPPPPVTGIPINIPIPSPGPVAAPSQWSSGLCDCFDDCDICCLTCWCPCITFGRIAEIVDRGATSCGLAGSIYTALLCFTGCQWIYSCTYRAKMRAQHGLPDVGCCDCCVHFCCEPCALCQQYKELKARGFDPELGWNISAQKAAANAAGGGGGGGMYPPAAQGMGR